MSPRLKLDESVAVRLGAKLRVAREATTDQHGEPMTQERAAHASGLSRNRIQLYEAGLGDREKRTPSNPTLANLMALCRVYGVSVVDLLRDVLGETPDRASADISFDKRVGTARPTQTPRR